LSLLPALAACSPYNYGMEVAGFSNDVDQVADAYKSGYAGLAADYAAQTRRLRILERTPLKLSSTCRVPVTEAKGSEIPCTLERADFRSAQPARPQPLQLDSDSEQATRKQLAAVASVLRDYVHGLAAGTNAEDRAALDKSLGQLADAVGEFAGIRSGNRPPCSRSDQSVRLARRNGSRSATLRCTQSRGSEGRYADA
jgi:hypothetical protein